MYLVDWGYCSLSRTEMALVAVSTSGKTTWPNPRRRPVSCHVGRRIDSTGRPFEVMKEVTEAGLVEKGRPSR